MKKETGKRIKFFRELRHLDKKTAAKLIKIPVPELQQYESGKKEITISKLNQIAIALKIPTNFLLDSNNIDLSRIKEMSLSINQETQKLIKEIAIIERFIDPVRTCQIKNNTQ